jgi:uncharacterized protein YqjF (DUF2071 family)
MSQRWDHLLYLHYRVATAELRARVPATLVLDEYEGSSWVSVIPLQMQRVHLRDVVPMPGTADFPELNVRTYVTHDGVPGVFFLSIDAASRFASGVARLAFDQPYHDAAMHVRKAEGTYHFISQRRSEHNVQFEATYTPSRQPLPASVVPRAQFLGERYAMYGVARSGRLIRGDISHLPWVATTVEVTVHRNDLLASNGVTALDPEPFVACSAGTASRCWPMRSAAVPQRIWPRR